MGRVLEEWRGIQQDAEKGVGGISGLSNIDRVSRFYEESHNALGVDIDEFEQDLDTITTELAEKVKIVGTTSSLLGISPFEMMTMVVLNVGFDLGVRYTRTQAEEMRKRVEGE